MEPRRPPRCAPSIPVYDLPSHPLSTVAPTSAWDGSFDFGAIAWLQLPGAARAYEGLWIALALLVVILLATIRASLQQSLASRVLPHVREDRARERLDGLLGRTEHLAISAFLLESAALVTFVGLLFDIVTTGQAIGLRDFAIAIAIGAPTVFLVASAIPLALARAQGDAILARVLPTFYVLQLPVHPISKMLDVIRGALLRTLRVPHHGVAQRRIVEGLRGVLEEAHPERELDETERALIENVMDFGDVDAAEVMTPRTEIVAVDVLGGVEAAEAEAIAEDCSRIPVYEGNIDTIIGTVSALALAGARANAKTGEAGLRALLRPPFLIPDTKLVSELLQEFRARRDKMAIVVDEYGGTAGLVTVTDAMREIFGALAEPAEDQDTIRSIGPGLFEVPAALHVSDVNESLDLDLPEEEDYETLAGFVLAHLGHLPKAGEGFEHEGVRYDIAEASDRRVLKVQVSRVA